MRRYRQRDWVQKPRVVACSRRHLHSRNEIVVRCGFGQILDAINALLEYDSEIRILIEPKPNEPMDIAYIPTIGHAIGLAYASDAPGARWWVN